MENLSEIKHYYNQSIKTNDSDDYLSAFHKVVTDSLDLIVTVMNIIFFPRKTLGLTPNLWK